jgi:hypothetical protein
MSETCPKCDSEAYDTVKWSWQQGVAPHADYYVCCSCYHEWDDSDIVEEKA